MAKSQIQSNPNMMLFSGDNINISSSFQNSVLNRGANFISGALPNNLELNVSIPNSEKLNLNNMNNNLQGGAFLYNNGNNLGSLPAAAANPIGLPNLNGNSGQVSVLNNQLLVKDINTSNYNNLSGFGLAGSPNPLLQQNLNPGLNLGLIGNGVLNAIPQGLNASLLPQPIPIQMDKSVNFAINEVSPQPQIGVGMFGILILFYYNNSFLYQKFFRENIILKFIFYLLYASVKYMFISILGGQAIPDRNSHMFNLNVQYKNQIPHQAEQVLDLVALERKVENLTNLPDTELSASKFKTNFYSSTTTKKSFYQIEF